MDVQEVVARSRVSESRKEGRKEGGRTEGRKQNPDYTAWSMRMNNVNVVQTCMIDGETVMYGPVSGSSCNWRGQRGLKV